MESENKTRRVVRKIGIQMFRLCRVLFIAGCALVLLPLLPVLLFLIDIFFVLDGSYRLFLASVEKTRSIYNKVVVRRTNTAKIPAADVLVRASEKPVPDRKSELLRSLAVQDRTPTDQLLRPTEGPINRRF